MVVHPGAGNREHTLQNALLAHDAKLKRVPRAGLVHRIDKDTSGLLVVARTLEAHTALVAELAAHEIEREYLAVCTGAMTGGGTVDEPIGRHRTQRIKMTVRSDGRAAVTHYRIEKRFRGHTLARVRLETGRTHQIRVHLAHVGYPIVGDPVYGGRRRLPAGATPELRAGARELSAPGAACRAAHAHASEVRQARGLRCAAARGSDRVVRRAGARSGRAATDELAVVAAISTGTCRRACAPRSPRAWAA